MGEGDAFVFLTNPKVSDEVSEQKQIEMIKKIYQLTINFFRDEFSLDYEMFEIKNPGLSIFDKGYKLMELISHDEGKLRAFVRRFGSIETLLNEVLSEEETKDITTMPENIPKSHIETSYQSNLL